MMKGTGASPGLVLAKVLKYEPKEIAVPIDTVLSEEVERVAFQEAVEQVKEENRVLCDQAEAKAGTAEKEIFEAHIEFLEDEDSVLNPIIERIHAGKSAAQATEEHFDSLIAVLNGLENELMRARANDFLDVKQQLLRRLLKVACVNLSALPEDVILVAHELTPTDTIKMDLTHVKGFVTETGGTTSHTAILARAVGLPAIVSCAGILQAVEDGMWIILDGGQGTVNLAPTPEDKQKLLLQQQAAGQERLALEIFRDRKTVTSDGKNVELLANIASPQECGAAIEHGCEGIGLFRSEFLYMESDELPDEETQMNAYLHAVQAARGRPVTIRTMDAGGDKNIPGLNIAKEENPFLGYRAVRICLDQVELFKTQLRAIYRASTAGALQIMFPMISSIDELRRAKQIAAEVRAELTENGIPFSTGVKLGMMVEIPSAAVLADVFAREVDFFSIGTNDLAQYTLAVDRGNDKVASLYTHYHPAVIRLIQNTIEAAHQNGIPCCMCGEAAGDYEFIPLLLGLGLDSFSMSPPKILRARKLISELSYEQCAALAQKVRTAKSAQEVRSVISATNLTD